MVSISAKEAKQQFYACATPDFNHNLIALLRSKQPLVYVSTTEETRLLTHFSRLCVMRECKGFIWDCFRGLQKLDDDRTLVKADNVDLRNPELMLNHIISLLEQEQLRRRTEEKKTGAKKASTTPGDIYVLLDFYRYMNPPNPAIQRRLKHLASSNKVGSIIITGPSYTSDPSLDKSIAVLDFPYPNEYELNEILDDSLNISLASGKFDGIEEYVKTNREKLIGAVKGLTLNEAQQAYFKSMVMATQLGHNPFDLDKLLREKREIIRKTDILEYIEPDVDLQDVGGLEVMTSWFADRKLAFTYDAQEYGLKAPKGVLLIGVPGCGKTLTAKAVAKDYGMSLLRWDFGRMMDSLVGESEKTTRSAIKLAESVAPCVSGSMKIYDAHGVSHTIESLLRDTDKFKSEEMYTWSFNEATKRVEKTQVKAVIRQPTKKKMLRIKTAHTFIEATEDHKLMVNRDGELLWLAANEVVRGDLLMAPKLFFRSKKECNWKDAITVKYESFPGDSVNPHGLAAKIGNDWQSLHLPSGFNLCILYYLVGMLDGGGWVDTENGISHFATENWYSLLSFASSISNLFMLEPEISGDKKSGYFADTTNKIAADILSYAFNHLFQQEDEIIANYLSGFMDSAGRVVDYDKAPAVYFDASDPAKRDRLKKAMHVFGILAPKETRSYLSLTAFGDIESLGLILDSRLDSHAESFFSILKDGLAKENKSVGFKLGKKLQEERQSLKMSKTDLGFTSAQMTRFEKDAIISFDNAWTIIEKLQSKISPGDKSQATKTDVAELVASDLIGVKVISIDEIGLDWAYDLACKGNHNFFANDILCHNCVLWVDEIEKGLSGGVGSGSGDSGTTKRVLSTFLTWLQEKKEPVFVIATANNVGDIPPEFMRAGRFDEVFFVDLPGPVGRKQIFNILLAKRDRNIDDFNLDLLAASSAGYSGAEIEKVIDSGMFSAFKDNKRPLTTEDILIAISRTKSLSVTRRLELDAMREWASKHCSLANTDVDPLASEKIEVPHDGSARSDNIDFG